MVLTGCSLNLVMRLVSDSPATVHNQKPPTWWSEFEAREIRDHFGDLAKPLASGESPSLAQHIAAAGGTPTYSFFETPVTRWGDPRDGLHVDQQ